MRITKDANLSDVSVGVLMVLLVATSCDLLHAVSGAAVLIEKRRICVDINIVWVNICRS